jgi:methylated-DNA-protein-cysteine methyltransferase related protein
VALGSIGIAVADSGGLDWAVKELSRNRLSLNKSANMRMRIEDSIRRIPKGKVSTYGAIARAVGAPRAARQVARVLRRGFGLPWQRVLGAGGEIKLCGDSAIEQRLRLEAEGVRFRGRRVDMRHCEFKFTGAGASKKRSARKN